MAVEVFIHKMSEHMETARIIQWLVKEGDPIQQFQVIMEVETDKAVAELESPTTGILKGIRPGAVDGAEVKVGETIAFIADPDEPVPALPPLQGAAVISPSVSPRPSASLTPLETGPGQVRATPVARRIAKEMGVDLRLIKGTGPDGRIKEEDVRAFVLAMQTPQPPQDTRKARVVSAPSSTMEDEGLELTPVQRLTGQRMVESLQTAPQFSLTLQADMTNALELRQVLMDRMVAETGEHLSITAILVKVVAEALKHHPRTNASFKDGHIEVHKAINIGVAVGSEQGLVVPVVREADRKSLTQVAQEVKSFQEKASQMRFNPQDLLDGTFTISNLGMYGIEQFNAILNPPQSAILAVGSVVKKPVGMPDDQIALRPMINLTLTIDHRVMDGIQGARFLAEVKEYLEKPFFLLRQFLRGLTAGALKG